MMTRWRRNVLFAVGAGLLILAAFVYSQREPAYHGKSLTEWFAEYAKPNGKTKLAREAILAMGESAVPFLVLELKAEEPHWRTFYRDKWSVVPVRMQKYLPTPAPPPSHVVEAINLLGAIGPPAHTAVPAILARLRNPNEPVDVRWGAVRALGTIHSHPEIATPALVRCVQTEPGPIGEKALISLSQFGDDARVYLPVVRAELAKTEDTSGIPTAEIILRIDGQDRAARELFLRQMTNTFDIYRLLASEALGRVGTNAAFTMPLLEAATKDRNAEIRKAATMALKQIDEASAGVKR